MIYLALLFTSQNPFYYLYWSVQTTIHIIYSKTCVFNLLLIHLLSFAFPPCHSLISSLCLFSLIVNKCQAYWPPVIFGEVVEDVHFIIVLQQAVGCTDMMALQHWAVIVQDSCVWPVKDKAVVSHWSRSLNTHWMLLQFINLSVKYVTYLFISFCNLKKAHWKRSKALQSTKKGVGVKAQKGFWIKGIFTVSKL